MGLEEKLPSGLLLTTVEKMGGYARKSSVWPAIFGLACCAIEPFQADGARHFATARARVPGVDAVVSSDARRENTRTVTRQPTGGRSGMS
jgi:NADH:ubiquinone oxidoreductase subunit B-like Fe-S oxidoreductase